MIKEAVSQETILFGDTASFTHLLFLRLFSSLAAWLFCSFDALGSLISFEAFDAEPFDLSFVFAITLNVNGYYFKYGNQSFVLNFLFVPQSESDVCRHRTDVGDRMPETYF